MASVKRHSAFNTERFSSIGKNSEYKRRGIEQTLNPLVNPDYIPLFVPR